MSGLPRGDEAMNRKFSCRIRVCDKQGGGARISEAREIQALSAELAKVHMMAWELQEFKRADELLVEITAVEVWS